MMPRHTRQQYALAAGDAWSALGEAEKRLSGAERAEYDRLILEAGDKPLKVADRHTILERARTTVLLGPLLGSESAKPAEQHRNDLFG